MQRSIEFLSQGYKIQGAFYLADVSAATHTALLLPGFPGAAGDVLDLGQRLSKSGIHTMTFNYRGTHGSEGTFSLKNTLEDIQAAYAYLHEGRVMREFQISTNELLLGGYSFGGGMAVVYTANPALAGLGYVYRRFGENLGNELSKGYFSEDVRLHKTIERDQLLNRSEEFLLEALNLSPKLVDDDGESYWGILGGLYKRRGQIDQAIEAYRRVTEVTPQSSYGYGNLALPYQKKNDRAAMLKTYEKVEQIASKEADAEAGNFWGYSDLVVSSFAIGKVEQAQAALPIAISIAPIDSPYML